METPEHERRDIERYLRSQSGPDFEIEHIEKLTSKYVLGEEYDVWDAHTNEGRWWVITNPTNLYSQEQIKSMDVALSFHVGLMSRMMARDARESFKRDARIRELLRRLDVASESLDRAKEVEDFQAVGMRLRELLVTLVNKIAELEPPVVNDQMELPKKADFKAWARIHAESIASGSASERLRSMLKTISAETWAYVNWLTHARNASAQDARIAFSATHQVVEAYLLALTRVQRGQPERCAVCTSYRLERVRTEDGQWVQLCAACGASSATDAPVMKTDTTDSGGESSASPEGECIEIEDFGLYVTPGQARSMIESAANQPDPDPDQPAWSNPFAYLLDDTLMDVHRIVFMTFEHQPAPGAELVYGCNEPSCVNAKHAVEISIPDEQGWHAAIVESATLRQSFIELQIGIAGSGTQRVFATSDILDRYGLSDASSLAERLVFVTMPSDDGWVQLVPAARRADYGQESLTSGWIHPPEKIKGQARCPCNSGKRYSACHGERRRREARP
jgi:hypothetical protein